MTDHLRKCMTSGSSSNDTLMVTPKPATNVIALQTKTHGSETLHSDDTIFLLLSLRNYFLCIWAELSWALTGNSSCLCAATEEENSGSVKFEMRIFIIKHESVKLTERKPPTLLSPNFNLLLVSVLSYHTFYVSDIAHSCLIFMLILCNCFYLFM